MRFHFNPIDETKVETVENHCHAFSCKIRGQPAGQQRCKFKRHANGRVHACPVEPEAQNSFHQALLDAMQHAEASNLFNMEASNNYEVIVKFFFKRPRRDFVKLDTGGLSLRA